MLGFVVILLILSAFFAASEMAFSTVNQIRMRKLADDNVRGARRALQIIENYDRTISTILVGNNLVNIASTTICAYLFSLVFINPTLANVLNTVIMTIIILIFGEITPKSWAKLNPETIALRFAKPMYFTLKIMYPIVFPFILIQNLFLKRAKNKNNASPIVAEDELESIIDTMEEEGILKSDDADLFMGVLEINEKTVYDVMTPRVDVVAINVDDTPEKINQTFLESRTSGAVYF
jgi:Mg2+/Co2+ transporter CorB